MFNMLLCPSRKKELNITTNFSDRTSICSPVYYQYHRVIHHGKGYILYAGTKFDITPIIKITIHI